MTQVAKELLLKDLCARLPYGVKIWYKYATWQKPWFCTSVNIAEETLWLGHKINKSDLKVSIIDIDEILIKPYLRLMSSMTEIERQKFLLASGYVYEVEDVGRHTERGYKDYVGTDNEFSPNYDAIDWLNAHHFDYRGLIEKGLALEAPEGMYKED